MTDKITVDEAMKKINKTCIGMFFGLLYRLFLYPYLERDKYYEELVNNVYENDIPRILTEMGYKKDIIKKVCDENSK